MAVRRASAAATAPGLRNVAPTPDERRPPGMGMNDRRSTAGGPGEKRGIGVAVREHTGIQFAGANRLNQLKPAFSIDETRFGKALLRDPLRDARGVPDPLASGGRSAIDSACSIGNEPVRHLRKWLCDMEGTLAFRQTRHDGPQVDRTLGECLIRTFRHQHPLQRQARPYRRFPKHFDRGAIGFSIGRNVLSWRGVLKADAVHSGRRTSRSARVQPCEGKHDHQWQG